MSSGFWLFILKFQVIKKRWILISSCTLIHTINNQSSETTLKSWFFGVAVLFGQYLNWISEAIFLCFQGTILCCGFINLTSEQVHTTCSMSVNIEELSKKKISSQKIISFLHWFPCQYIYLYASSLDLCTEQPTLCKVSRILLSSSYTMTWFSGSVIWFTSPRIPSILFHRTTALSGSQPWTDPPANTLLMSLIHSVRESELMQWKLYRQMALISGNEVKLI